MKNKSFQIFRWAAAFGFLAVALGAFGAHGLKPRLSEYQIAIFEKAVQYQFYHSLAVGVCAVLLDRYPDRRYFYIAAVAFTAGILLFSGSLYLLACRDLLPFSVAWAGPVTPVGGLCFMAGWLSAFIAAKPQTIE